MNNKRLTIFGLLIMTGFIVRAQPAYSLSDCIRIATTENAQVRQAEVSADIAEEARKNAGNVRLTDTCVLIWWR